MRGSVSSHSSHAQRSPLDPFDSARTAGLRHVDPDAIPGIRRVRRGRGYSYVDADGKPVRDEETLGRIRRLAIPPAWERVWICPVANGHIQAHGRDARGRKQYRYDARWAEVRSARTLRALEPCAKRGQARKNVVDCIKTVASHLGNTPAVCKRSYVHPAVLEAYLDGKLVASAGPDEEGIARAVLRRAARATEPELLSTALEARVTALAKGRRNGRRRSSGPLRSRPHERADRVLERAGGAAMGH